MQQVSTQVSEQAHIIVLTDKYEAEKLEGVSVKPSHFTAGAFVYMFPCVVEAFCNAISNGSAPRS